LGLFFNISGFETGAGGFEGGDGVGGGEEVVFCFWGMQEGVRVDEGSGGVGLGGGGHDWLVWKDGFAEGKGVVDGGEVWLECEEVFSVLFIGFGGVPG